MSVALLETYYYYWDFIESITAGREDVSCKDTEEEMEEEKIYLYL
jgi:hypothetical protein